MKGHAQMSSKQYQVSEVPDLLISIYKKQIKEKKIPQLQMIATRLTVWKYVLNFILSQVKYCFI